MAGLGRIMTQNMIDALCHYLFHSVPQALLY